MSNNSSPKNRKNRNPNEKHGIVCLAFFIGLLVFILSLIFLKGTVQTIAGFVSLGITVLNVIMIIYYASVSRGYCEKCGERLKPSNFSYTFGKTTTTEKRVYVLVDFKAVCGKCAKEKRFSKEFTAVSIDLNGWQKKHDVEKEVRNFIANI